MLNDRDTLLKDIERIILDPPACKWTTQGLGMLRTYLDEKRVYRLNIWDNRLKRPGVSTVHDHPWDFRSWIIAGSIANIRYVETGEQTPETAHSYVEIKCGPGGGRVKPQGDIDLQKMLPEVYGPGQTYVQRRDEIHETFAWDGTITVIERVFHPDTEHARVFWPRGRQWVDAEPRAATESEIRHAVDMAWLRLRKG
jgi:hypothetical protein